MKGFRSFVFLLCFLTSNLVFAAPISASKLFDSPDNNMVKISPNGEYISAHQIKENSHYLSVFNSKGHGVYSVISIGNDRVLNDYFWLNDQQLFFDITQEGYQVNLIGTFIGDKIEIKAIPVKGQLVHYLPEQPNKILFAKRKNKNTRSSDLYLIDIESLVNDDFASAYKVKHNEKNIENYYYNSNFKRVITGEYDEKNKSIVIKYVPLDGGKWQTLISLTDTDYRLEPVDFINTESLGVLTNKDNDKIVLRSFNIKTKELGEVIYQHPKYDLISAGFTNDGELDYVTFKQHGLNQKLFFDKGKSTFRNRLMKTFVNQEVYIVEQDKKKNTSILWANGSDEPGQYYVYNQDTDNADFFLPSYTELLEQQFSSSEQLTILADDGIELEAFLTRPKGYDHSTLLVMPHGGPIGVQESDRFNQEVQYYTSRGFTVLRVNFRGAAGFGKAFLEKGVGEFGKQIERDITTVISYVKQRHQFKYQCAMGASYGGYSASMLAIKHPDDYDCVIAAFGIYDLPLLFNSSNYRSGDEYQKQLEKVVGKMDENLNSVSPFYLAKKLKAPILLIAGRDDQTADFEHSNRFKYILNKLNHPMEFMFYKNTGHGHRFWSGDIHEAALSYDFLMRTLKLTYPLPTQLNKASKEAIADDYAAIADGYNFDGNVDNNKEKAFDYYQKAAFYDHPRANFNIGSNYHSGKLVTANLQKAVEYYQISAKFDYENAFARIGRMYMEGEYFSKNWPLALDNLLKAQELDDSPFNNIRLARFYCVAEEKYKNIDKCIGLMDLAQYEQISKKKVRLAKQQIEETLAWVFLSSHLTQEELNKLKDFAVNLYRLTDIEAFIDDPRMGQFEFVESDVFGVEGEYSLLKNHQDPLTSDNDNARFGLLFKVDIPGINSRNDRVAIAAQWEKINSKGERSYPLSTILYGSPEDDWQLLRPLKDIKEEETWTLKLYDLNQKQLYTKQFKVAPSKPK